MKKYLPKPIRKFLHARKLYLSLSLVSVFINVLSPIILSFGYVAYAEGDTTSESSQSASLMEETPAEVVEEKPIVVEDSATVSTPEETTTEITTQESPEVPTLEEPSQTDVIIAPTDPQNSQPQVLEEPVVKEETVSKDTTPQDNATVESSSSTVNETTSPSVLNGVAEARLEATPQEIIDAKEKVDEQECLSVGGQVINSPESFWEVNSTDQIATTKDVVKIGVKYEFPLDKNVSVTFKCLPKDFSERSTLKIRAISTSELKLPKDIVAASTTAYDITTEMKDGTFEYDVVFPKPEGSLAQVVYTEKSIDELKATSVSNSDLNKLDTLKTDKSSDEIIAVGVDHFTTFVPVINPTPAWSGSIGWTQYLTLGGAVVNDFEDDAFGINDSSNGGTNVSPSSIDLASGANFSGVNPGNESTLEYYYDSNSTSTCDDDSLYLRMRLVGDPRGGGGLYNSYHWDFLVGNPVSTSASDYVIDIFGGKASVGYSNNTPSSGTIGVYKNDASSTTYTPNTGIVWARRADKDGNANTRLEEITYDNGNKQYWIEGYLPLSTFTANAAQTTFKNYICNAAKSSEGFKGRLFASTSASNTDPLQKDWMDATAFFTKFSQSKSVVNTTNPGATTEANPAKAGDKLVYTLSVKNEGTRSIPGFVIQDDINDILQYATLTNADADSNSYVGSVTSGVIKWTARDISVGATLTEKFEVTVKPVSSWPVGGDFKLSNVYGNSVDVYLLKVGSIKACKFNDANENQTKDSTEAYLPNWEITLTTPAANIKQTTGSDGCTVFNDLTAGSYTVAETPQTTWTNTTPLSKSVTVTAGQQSLVEFGNVQRGYIVVNKVVINDNGGTAVVSDFPLFVDSTSVTSGQVLEVAVGNHTVSETNSNAYTSTISGDCANNGVVTVAAGETKTCTITNNDKPATLIVKKVLDLKYNGSAVASDFVFSVNGADAVNFEADGQNDLTVNAGTYSISEAAVDGYTPSYSNCSRVTVANGETATCTITNSDLPATLIVKKVITNDNGGAATYRDFSFKINNGSSTNFDASGTNTFNLAAGTYNVVENETSEYFTAYDGCANIQIKNGETKTCTITNNDKPATLIVKKVMDLNYGGKAFAGNFNFNVSGTNATPSTFAGSASGQTVTLDAGNYDVQENSASGYSANYSTDCTGSIKNGETKTCTVTNSDIQPKLIVIKKVVNTNGGTLKSSDFTMSVTGTSVSPTTFSGDENGTTVVLNEGNFSVDEKGPSGYEGKFSEDCSGYISVGETKTCTVTNGDLPGTLVIKKHVINDNGGTKTADDFTLNVSGSNVSSSTVPGSEAGVSVTLNAGSFEVTEANYTGYTTSTEGDCAGTIANGETKYCTIINDDQAATLKVIKHVINDNGGLLSASDFSLYVNGTDVSTSTFAGDENGTTVTLSAGSYDVGETLVAGYSLSTQGDCRGTIANGETKTCTLINDDQTATLKVVKHVVNNYGGTKAASDFNLTISQNNVEVANFSGDEEGTSININAGSYSVDETAVTGYKKTLDEDCTGTLANGETKTCTITNEDIQPKLTVNKVVSPENIAPISDFPLFVNRTQVTSGAANGFNAGNYTISETNKAGFTSSFSGDCDSTGKVTLNIGDVKSCTITNTRDEGNITVSKDVVPNDESLWNITVEGPSNNKATLADGESTEVLASYTGHYTVSEAAHTGTDGTWYTSSYSCSFGERTVKGTGTTVEFDLSKGADVSCNFTNLKLSSISGSKFEYVPEENITNEGGLPKLSGWTIELFDSEWSKLDQKATVEGDYSFEKLAAGTYYVCEQNQAGWKQLSPLDEANNNCYKVVLENGQNITEKDFTNAELTDIHGYKFNDLNGNGRRDLCNEEYFRTCVDEPLLSGWTIFLDENGNRELDEGENSMDTSSTREHFGWYWFENLMPGTYNICEVQKAGWSQTYPNVEGDAVCHTVVLPRDGHTNNLSENAVVGPEFNFGNHRDVATLTITKSNNAGSTTLHTGDLVKYTIKLMLTGNAMDNVSVYDLLPKGFKFNAGSWKVTSNIHGNVSIAAPEYHSPGKWLLGDMSKDEELTLTYTATIDSTVDAGKYKDLAYAFGTNMESKKQFAEAGTEGYVSKNYVGTLASVGVAPLEETSVKVNKTVEEISAVLGASTVRLPATGSNLLWLYIFAVLGLAGSALISYALLREKVKTMKLTNLKLFGVFIVLAGLFSGTVRAESDSSVMVRVEEPKTPINSEFNITFVALDTNNNELVAECWKKSPEDSSFVKFGSDINVISGGDTNNCVVDSNVLDNSGNYQFKVVVYEKGNSENSATSETYTVAYDSTSPDRPKYIEKDKQSKCEYKITVKTANDSQTTYVEVYRDDDTNIEIGSGSLVKTINMGPDEKQSFDDTLSGECKTPYYAVRAFNAQGTPSKVRVEEINEKKTVNKGTTTTNTEETGAIEVAGGSNIINPQGEQQGEVAGASTTSLSNESSVTGATNPDGSPVQGAQGFFGKLVKNWWILGIMLVVIVGLLKSKKKQN